MEKFSFDCYNILTNGTATIKFFVNIINDLVFTIISISLLHTIFEGTYLNFLF